jgi:asparagine synthase (glutamine-hydrolysing)
MLTGVERLVDLSGFQQSTLIGRSSAEIKDALRNRELATLAAGDEHFAAVAREGQTVRLARTIGVPLRYFVAKMFHGPFIVVSDRIDSIFNWCREQKIGWQFDPAYTRMVPAHYLVELDQIGCPDPAPRYHRFFTPRVGEGSAGIEEAGAVYVRAAYEALKRWISSLPEDEPLAVAFSGGVDSTSVLLLAQLAMKELRRDASLFRAFTLDLGGGKDAAQAESVVRDLEMHHQWEAVRVPAERVNHQDAIRVIEDYHPLDVECAAVALCLLEALRERHPTIKYLLDGDGGDENLKSYPLEDSDLTLSSVLKNPLLYHEGWGVDAIKHSLTYSGGLSRSYVRTYAPAKRYGFESLSPYTVRSVIAAALAIPFERVLGANVEALYSLKQRVVRAGVKALTGVDMPVHPKQRFQDGAGGPRKLRIGKAWCRQVFLRQWQERLRDSWDSEEQRVSGNAIPASAPAMIA